MRPEVVDRIRVLVGEGKTDTEIADDLSQRHWRTVHEGAAGAGRRKRRAP